MSGLFFHNNESGYNDESFAETGGGMSTSNTSEELQDNLSTKWALRRLLYRMERYEDLKVLQDNNDNNSSSSNNLHCQSWQSLLVRAQLCQTLWQRVAFENVDEGSDPQLRKEYMELSQRVDAACKKAQLLADRAREQEIQEGTEQDIVGKLFFVVSDDESETAPGEGGEEKGLSTEVGESDPQDDYYDEFDDDDDDESEAQNPSRQHNTSNTNHRAEPTPNLQDLQKAQREQIEEAIAMMAKQMKESTQGIRKTLQKQNANTLHELENVAEQNMEDVSKVASNVKEHVVANRRSSWATWTTMILIVGVFIFCLVTIFTIPKHPDANLGRILTNENGPYARLLQKTMHTIRSVFTNESAKTETDEQHQEEEEHWDDYEIPQDEVASDVHERLNQLVRDMQSGGRKAKQQQQEEREEEDEKLIQQEQEKRQHDEQLRKLQEELQEKERLRQEAKRQQEETLRKQKLEEEEEEEKRKQEDRIRKQNLELEQQQRAAQERREQIKQKKLQEQERLKRQKLEEEERLKLQKLEQERQDTARNEKDVFDQETRKDDENSRGVAPEEESEPMSEKTSVHDILASLKKKQQEPMANNDEIETEKVQEDEPIEVFKPPQLDREGVAAKMVSPRDFRLAAASNDYETLQRYLEMAPQHINRQDKHGWTALHMAVHGHYERIVTLLLDQAHGTNDMADLAIDPFVESYEEKRTALDLALEQFGLEHPITEAFFSSGWYERSEYEDWGNEEARLRKQKLLEHEARIAKEKEAIDAKEARYAAAAEEERKMKKDKLDKLFGTPIEEEDDEDDIDEDVIQERRNRLDALLDEL